MLETLNVVAVAILGLYKVRGRPRVFVILASLTASAAVLLLGRVESRGLMVTFGEVQFSWFQLAPFLYASVAVVAAAKIRRTTALLVGLTVLVAVYGAAYWIVGAGEPVEILFATTAFVGPMLSGVFVGVIDRRGAEFLVARIRALLSLAAVLALASGIAGQWFTTLLGWEWIPIRGLSPLGGPIATGAALLLVWPKIYADAIEKRRMVDVALALVCLAAFLLMGSRMNGLAALLGVVPATVRFLLSRPVAGLWRLLVAGTLAAAIGLSLADLPSVGRFARIPGTSNADVRRLESLETGLSLIVERPLTGWGPGQVYPWYRADLSIPGGNLTAVQGMPTLVEPHNLYVMIAVEYGLPVLIIFTGVLAWIIVNLAWEGRYDHKASLFHAAVGIFTFMVAAMGSSHLQVNARVATVFWLFVGGNCVFLRRTEWRPSVPPSRDHITL